MTRRQADNARIASFPVSRRAKKKLAIKKLKNMV